MTGLFAGPVAAWEVRAVALRPFLGVFPQNFLDFRGFIRILRVIP
jgi:hypothetical protein